MSSFTITNADLTTLTNEAQYSINQKITQNHGATWSLTQTSSGLSFSGTLSIETVLSQYNCFRLSGGFLTTSLVSYKNNMANNPGLMDDQYDPDFDTLSMLSDDSGYYN